jgi:hypothetical protein
MLPLKGPAIAARSGNGRRVHRHISWRDGTPDNFLFALKGSRFLTHLKKLRNGHVRLAIEVDKDVSNIRANGVPNVLSVSNDLEVESGK